MKFRNLLAVAAATSLTVSPVLAQSRVEAQREAAPVAQAEAFGGDSTILLILAVILIGAGIFVLADNQDDTPTSP